MYITYILLSTKILAILPISCHTFCTAKRNGICVHSMSFLRADYSIPCPTLADNKTRLIISYLCLSIPIGIPVVLFFLLRWYVPRTRTNICTDDDDDNHFSNSFRVHPINGDEDPSFQDSTVPMVTSAIKFTYENYHSRYWYWEVIEMIRKLLMAIGIALFVGRTKIGLACIITIAMIFAILHAIQKPFKNNFESGAQFLSLMLIPMNLAYGAVHQSPFKQSPNVFSKEIDTLSLRILLVAMNSSLVIIIFVRISIIILKRYR